MFQAGTLLLTEAALVNALVRASQAPWRGGGRRARCTTPGKILTDLAIDAGGGR